MCHSHIEGLVGWERDMTGQQGWLLHDGIVMAAMRVGIPPVGKSLCAAHGVGDDSGMLD